MGEVWVADQLEPVRRRVALKLVKPGMDSRGVLARFEAERQALALMDHPNIAKVLDAGTTDGGRPYFVMELVKGTPITAFCDARRLTPRERLALFVPVCQAIQHAHQKGVVHRDVKPGNVLVALHDEVPVPKVIDFGVAKAVGQPLTERTVYTGFGTLVGTPAYMAPEQATFNQLDVDTRADVYALGVLLYELLTGGPPFEPERLRRAAFDEMLRLVREEEPPRPSHRLSTAEARATIAANRGTEAGRLARLVRGDLDWVVMKALEKDRARRYETASALGRDVQRFLADEPVEARPPSVRYRVRKFVRRNRGGVLAAGAVLLALVVGVVGTTWGLVRATDAEADARGEAAEKEKARKEAVEALGKVTAAEAEARAALGSERHALSIYGVALAEREWAAGNLRQADLALDGCPPETRRWEWHYLKRLAHPDRLRVVLPRPVARGGFSPDGRRFAGGGAVWDVETGREVAAFDPKTAQDVVFSPDGGRVVVVRPRGTTVHDAATGKEVARLAEVAARLPGTILGESARYAAAFSADGRRLAVTGPAAGQRLAVYDAATHEPVFRLDLAGARHYRHVALSPDGRQVAVSLGGAAVKGGPDGFEIQLKDGATGAAVRTLSGHPDRVTDLAYSPDGKHLASGGTEGTVRLWDPAAGEARHTLTGHAGPVLALRFGTDGRLLASAGQDGTVRLWEVATGREVSAYRGHQGSVHSVGFGAGGATVCSAGADGTLRVWDIGPANPRPLGVKVNAVLFAPGDRMATVTTARVPPPDPKGGAVGLATQVRLWDTRTFREPPAKDFPGGLLPVSHDRGRWLTVRRDAGALVAVDVETGRDDPALPPIRPGVELTPDWQRVVAAGVFHAGQQMSTGGILARDPGSGRLVVSEGKGTPVRAAFHPAGRHLLLFEADEPARWLDAETGREVCVLKGEPAPFAALALSPDGRYAASGSNTPNRPGVLRVWDLRDGAEAAPFDGHPDGIASLAFSPDGRRLASGSRDKSVKVWDTKTGRELLTLRGHAAAVRQVAFSPDGHFLVSVGVDGAVLVWDGRPWDESQGRVVDLSGGTRWGK
jgi:WD40 repeat protein